VTQTSTNSCILVFARTPIPGECKTRLIPVLGKDGATKLHTAMIQHTLVMTSRSGLGQVQLWCTPSPQHPFFIACANQHSLSLHQQTGHDLGARMAHAVEHALQQYQWVILIGTDCPSLDENYLRRARDQLSSGCDAVIGPAHDGGYTLIALRQSVPAIFQDIEWGTESVLQQTRQRLSKFNFHWVELDKRHDIDTPDDLAPLITANDVVTLGAYQIPIKVSG